MVGAVVGDEALQPIEAAHLEEQFGDDLECIGRIEDAGRDLFRFLLTQRVGAESVPKKNDGLPDVAATIASRSSRELMTGLQ